MRIALRAHNFKILMAAQAKCRMIFQSFCMSMRFAELVRKDKSMTRIDPLRCCLMRIQRPNRVSSNSLFQSGRSLFSVLWMKVYQFTILFSWVDLSRRLELPPWECWIDSVKEITGRRHAWLTRMLHGCIFAPAMAVFCVTMWLAFIEDKFSDYSREVTLKIVKRQRKWCSQRRQRYLEKCTTRIKYRAVFLAILQMPGSAFSQPLSQQVSGESTNFVETSSFENLTSLDSRIEDSWTQVPPLFVSSVRDSLSHDYGNLTMMLTSNLLQADRSDHLQEVESKQHKSSLDHELQTHSKNPKLDATGLSLEREEQMVLMQQPLCAVHSARLDGQLWRSIPFYQTMLLVVSWLHPWHQRNTFCAIRRTLNIERPACLSCAIQSLWSDVIGRRLLFHQAVRSYLDTRISYPAVISTTVDDEQSRPCFVIYHHGLQWFTGTLLLYDLPLGVPTPLLFDQVRRDHDCTGDSWCSVELDGVVIHWPDRVRPYPGCTLHFREITYDTDTSSCTAEPEISSQYDHSNSSATNSLEVGWGSQADASSFLQRPFDPGVVTTLRYYDNTQGEEVDPGDEQIAMMQRIVSVSFQTTATFVSRLPHQRQMLRIVLWREPERLPFTLTQGFSIVQGTTDEVIRQIENDLDETYVVPIEPTPNIGRAMIHTHIIPCQTAPPFELVVVLIRIATPDRREIGTLLIKDEVTFELFEWMLPEIDCIRTWDCSTWTDHGLFHWPQLVHLQNGQHIEIAATPRVASDDATSVDTQCSDLQDLDVYSDSESEGLIQLWMALPYYVDASAPKPFDPLIDLIDPMTEQPIPQGDHLDEPPMPTQSDGFFNPYQQESFYDWMALQAQHGIRMLRPYEWIRIHRPADSLTLNFHQTSDEPTALCDYIPQVWPDLSCHASQDADWKAVLVHPTLVMAASYQFLPHEYVLASQHDFTLHMLGDKVIIAEILLVLPDNVFPQVRIFRAPRQTDAFSLMQSLKLEHVCTWPIQCDLNHNLVRWQRGQIREFAHGDYVQILIRRYHPTVQLDMYEKLSEGISTVHGQFPKTLENVLMLSPPSALMLQSPVAKEFDALIDTTFDERCLILSHWPQLITTHDWSVQKVHRAFHQEFFLQEWSQMLTMVYFQMTPRGSGMHTVVIFHQDIALDTTIHTQIEAYNMHSPTTSLNVLLTIGKATRCMSQTDTTCVIKWNGLKTELHEQRWLRHGDFWSISIFSKVVKLGEMQVLVPFEEQFPELHDFISAQTTQDLQDRLSLQVQPQPTRAHHSFSLATWLLMSRHRSFLLWTTFVLWQLPQEVAGFVYTRSPCEGLPPPGNTVTFLTRDWNAMDSYFRRGSHEFIFDWKTAYNDQPCERPTIISLAEELEIIHAPQNASPPCTEHFSIPVSPEQIAMFVQAWSQKQLEQDLEGIWPHLQHSTCENLRDPFFANVRDCHCSSINIYTDGSYKADIGQSTWAVLMITESESDSALISNTTIFGWMSGIVCIDQSDPCWTGANFHSSFVSEMTALLMAGWFALSLSSDVDLHFCYDAITPANMANGRWRQNVQHPLTKLSELCFRYYSTNEETLFVFHT